MRIVIATAALAGVAIATTAVALTPRRAHAQTLDRYGGSAAAHAQPIAGPGPYPQPAYAALPAYAPPTGYTPTPSTPSAAAAGLRTLTWPGKDAPVAVPPPAQMASAPMQAYAPSPRFAPPPTRYAPAATATLPASGGVQPRPTVLRPVQVPANAQVGAAPQPYALTPAAPPPAPASIYSDAPAAPSPAAYRPAAAGPTQARTVAQAEALTPAQRADRLGPPDPNRSRLYSLHREYGMTPDPDPIPPTFFAATADLSTPETPDVAPRTGSTASKAAQNAARLAAAAGQ